MERLTSSSPDKVRRYHEARYRFAQHYAKGKRVIDVACGDGYGSVLLAAESTSVTSVDPNAQIAYALSTYVRKFAEELMYKDEFDLAVSFETLEHSIAPNLFLHNVWSALKPRGVLIMSFPNDWGESQFHLHNTSWATLDLICQYFKLHRIFGQNRTVQVDPIPIQKNAFWVENIIVVGEKLDGIVHNIWAVEQIYSEIAEKQRQLRGSLAWKVKQLLPRLKTALKRRGICLRP